ncbi:MFS transporter [uncultured Jatrophihabitans sp.]|uniref:MFS transporter n=1 Tax=uncultured Jatrophihabitans sp. TaxID=1610747 RepID=UPI0035CC6B3F
MPTVSATSQPSTCPVTDAATSPDEPAATSDAGKVGTRLRRLPRAAAFWLVGLTAATLLAASSAPSPLYPVFQAEFGFSAITLTSIFAVYVLALLAALLTVGRLSDFIGRRPVLAAALVVEAGAMAVFLGADSVTWLVAARIVQGLATGAAVGVLGAYLLDLQPPDGSRLGSLVNSVAPTSGLGLGAIGTGVLVQYAPHPTKLVFVVLLVLFGLLLAATAVLPETVRRVPGGVAALRPTVAVPAPARTAFLTALPTMLATWALGGLVFSVGGSLLGSVFDQRNEAVIGLVLGVFALAGAAAALAFNTTAPETVTLVGVAALVAGTVLFLIGVAAASLTVFVIAAVVSGAGFGSAFLGSLRSMTQLAEPHQRAGLLSAVYVVSYLAFSIPAVVGGVLITHIGIRDTSLGYGALVGLLALTSLALGLVTLRRARPAGG